MTSGEFMYMIKNVFLFVSIAFRAFVKSALLHNVCTLCTAHTFITQISGSDYGRVSTTYKTFGPFSEWDFSPKKTFPRRVFSSLNVNKENPVEILPTYAIGHSPIVHYIRSQMHKLTLVLL